MSGKLASATARTMRGMLIMKSAIDFVETLGSGFLLLAPMLTGGGRADVKGPVVVPEHCIAAL